LVRGYAYIRTLGPDGLRAVSENAVLNANYLLAKLKSALPVPHGDRCMHEFVASCKNLRDDRHITALDICKRLLDYGFHPPTMYFPLVVTEALMIEPTETESKETLDAFAAAFISIFGEDPELVRQAPHTTPIRRADETKAGRDRILRWG
jgi:glycine dehydrogenase subunit 2